MEVFAGWKGGISTLHCSELFSNDHAGNKNPAQTEMILFS
jgi:hypothetical protein